LMTALAATWVGAVAAALGGGCGTAYERIGSDGDGDTDADVHGNADADADADTDADSDLDSDTGIDAEVDTEIDADDDVLVPECSRDEDCVVVLHQDRCCYPNPRAVTRAVLEADPCLHELGQPWGGDSLECRSDIDCDGCGSITDRFYAAQCDQGRCVGVVDFCEPMQAPASVGLFEAQVTPSGGWAQYRGQVVTVMGQPTPGPASAECTGVEECTGHEVQMTLDCAITVRGSVCGQPWECTGRDCEATCSPDQLMYAWRLATEGYLVDAAGVIEVWPLTPIEECGPRGPNPAGAPCSVYDDDDEGGCAEGLVCHYWGDVISICDGTCMLPGTECAEETEELDCPEGDVCYQGYCEWCCPG
jgi:hypothetical protein